MSIALILSRIEAFHQFLLHLGNFGYIGVFVAGILFVSTFTVATGAVIIASPFPDELGVSLMGISKMKTYQFLIVAIIMSGLGSQMGCWGQIFCLSRNIKLFLGLTN